VATFGKSLYDSQKEGEKRKDSMQRTKKKRTSAIALGLTIVRVCPTGGTSGTKTSDPAERQTVNRRRVLLAKIVEGLGGNPMVQRVYRGGLV